MVITNRHLMKDLEKNNINLFGKRGKTWIEDLPKIVKVLALKWELTDIEPVNNMSWNYVAKASSKIHSSVCLKISIDKNLIADEIKALTHFDGHGMIKLIDHDTQLNALLLHQAIPGKSLKNLYLNNKEKAIKNYASVVQKLLAAPKVDHKNYKSVEDWLKAFDRIPVDKLPSGLIQKAKSLSQQLLELKPDEFILHGDLHMDNIISDNETWMAIDPKGIVGPKEFEIACFDFITKDELETNQNVPQLFSERAFKLCQLLAIDKQILSDWVFIRLVLGACWMIEDNGKADVFLNQVKAIFPERLF